MKGILELDLYESNCPVFTIYERNSFDEQYMKEIVLVAKLLFNMT